MQMDHTAAESAFTQQVEVQPDLVGKPRGTAAYHHRRDEEVQIVDETSRDCLARELGPAHGDVLSRGRLQVSDRARIERRAHT